MLYHAYEMAHATLFPLRQVVVTLDHLYSHPISPLTYTPAGPYVRAGCQLFDRLTSRYGKPEFEIDETRGRGVPMEVHIRRVAARTFCDLLHFERAPRKDTPTGPRDPRVLIVAPMSGHYATLLRGTVHAMLPEHDVFVTDWRDARTVPVGAGRFDLGDYIDYLIDFLRLLGPGTHVLAVCQPSVPALAATALLAMDGDPCRPASLTAMAGPVDARINPTVVNRHAQSHALSWFERRVITTVPLPHWGFGRRVYPGFLQLSGFLAMNIDRHLDAYRDYFLHLVDGDADSVQQHRAFYDEYLAVMDLTAEFFLQTVDEVFQRHLLALGRLEHRGRRVDCGAIRDTTLMTVEGEADDICGLGQTEAAHRLCRNLPAERRYHYVQAGVGHYGVFNGTRWRTEIQPRIREMIRTTEARRGRRPSAP